MLYRRNRYYDPASGRFTQEDPIGIAGGMNQYGFGRGDPVNSSDPFGLAPDTSFADERARQETQKCVSESKTCAELIGVLANDKSKWNIATRNILGSDLGEPEYESSETGELTGGTLVIEGRAEKYADASDEIGEPITYGTILAHEAGHGAINLFLQALFSPLAHLSSQLHCNEQCALGPTNAYRNDVGLRPLGRRQP